MGWDLPLVLVVSAVDFNYDYGVTFDATVDTRAYNYRTAAELQARGCRRPRASYTARACSCATAIACSTPTRPTGAAPSGRRHALLPRHDGARPPGGLGRSQGSARPPRHRGQRGTARGRAAAGTPTGRGASPPRRRDPQPAAGRSRTGSVTRTPRSVARKGAGLAP